MARFVLDCSVALSWLLPDEASGPSKAWMVDLACIRHRIFSQRCGRHTYSEALDPHGPVRPSLSPPDFYALFVQRLSDYIEGGIDLFLIDYQRWRETHHGVMGFLAEQSVLHQREA